LYNILVLFFPRTCDRRYAIEWIPNALCGNASCSFKNVMAGKNPADPQLLNASKARSKLSAVLDLVAKNGKTVFIGRYGRPLAAMVPMKEYRQLVQYRKYAEFQKAALPSKDPSKPSGRLSVGERMALELEIELGLY